MLLAANVWHYWIGVVLTIAAVLTVIGVIAGYVAKVQAPQHPKRNQRR